MPKIASAHGTFINPLKNKVRKQIINSLLVHGFMVSGQVEMALTWAMYSLVPTLHYGFNKIEKFLFLIITSREKAVWIAWQKQLFFLREKINGMNLKNGRRKICSQQIFISEKIITFHLHVLQQQTALMNI